MNDAVRTIAFYLPQYHPVPENDEWWGRGFTEWTNVAKARPLFPDHYQPHLPADLGFYDLRLPETREAQASLAKRYGIHGFCYYHYWFNGRRILDRPFAEVLKSGKPDFPFCLCWANENWTRAWDGGVKQLLLRQEYSEEDDVKHIESLLPALGDPRYIRINGRPLLLIYRVELLPSPGRTAQVWRAAAREAGLGELYLACVESFRADVHPETIGFDAAVEFAPDWRTIGDARFRTGPFRAAVATGALPELYRKNFVVPYESLVRRMLAKPKPQYRRFPCATPGFDNSPRRKSGGAVVYTGNTPNKYRAWLQSLAQSVQENPREEQIIFINAWNEWAEGNHLEPDERFGCAFLEATRDALGSTQTSFSKGDKPDGNGQSGVRGPNVWKRAYWRLRSQMKEVVVTIKHITFWRCRRDRTS